MEAKLAIVFTDFCQAQFQLTIAFAIELSQLYYQLRHPTHSLRNQTVKVSKLSNHWVDLHQILNLSSVAPPWVTSENNTPGTAGGPGGRDQTLAVKSRKTAEKSVFFRKKIKIT